MNKEDKQRLDRICRFGCIVCFFEGYADTPAMVHHLREGQGQQKASHQRTIPLCDGHHQHSVKVGGSIIKLAYHDAPEQWEKRYGTQQEFLALMDRILLLCDEKIEALKATGV